MGLIILQDSVRKNNVRPAKHNFLMALVFAREQNEMFY